MFDKGLFGGLLDFDHNGKMDSFEKAAEIVTFAHLVNELDKEKADTSGSAINEYLYEDQSDDIDAALSDAGLDRFDLELMDDNERTEALEDAGLDPDDFDFSSF